MNNKKADIFLGVLFLLFSAISYSLIIKLPKGATTEFGLGFFPMIMTSLLVFLSFILLIKGIISYRKQINCVNSDSKIDKQSIGRILIMTFLMIGYAFLYERIGFFVSTITFVLLAMFLLKVRNKLILATVPFMITGVIYIGFSQILNVVLP